MTSPAIITVAIAGAVPRKADTAAVPVTPSEQIESVWRAATPSWSPASPGCAANTGGMPPVAAKRADC